MMMMMVVVRINFLVGNFIICGLLKQTKRIVNVSMETHEYDRMKPRTHARALLQTNQRHYKQTNKQTTSFSHCGCVVGETKYSIGLLEVENALATKPFVPRRRGRRRPLPDWTVDKSTNERGRAGGSHHDAPHLPHLSTTMHVVPFSTYFEHTTTLSLLLYLHLP